VKKNSIEERTPENTQINNNEESDIKATVFLSTIHSKGDRSHFKSHEKI